MGKLSYYLTLALAVSALAVSCDKNDPPKFKDSDAFVAFSSETASIDEGVLNADGTIGTAATLRIPVTLASVKGLTETVSFEVNDEANLYTSSKNGQTVDQTAHENVNWRLLTTSKTLTFDAENRTQYIEFQILYYDRYTGDLKFDVTLNQPAGVKLGYMKTCTVTIGDIDHPLSSMLGAYTATSTGTAYSPSWTMTFYKDDSDDHKVWIDNIFANAGFAIAGTRFYGNVSDDLSVINIPLGQNSEYKYNGETPVTLYGLYGDFDDDDATVSKSGSTNASIVTENGVVTKIVFSEDCGFYALLEDLGYVGFASPQITAVKN